MTASASKLSLCFICYHEIKCCTSFQLWKWRPRVQQKKILVLSVNLQQSKCSAVIRGNVKIKHNIWKIGEHGLLLFIYTSTHFNLQQPFSTSKVQVCPPTYSTIILWCEGSDNYFIQVGIYHTFWSHSALICLLRYLFIYLFHTTPTTLMLSPNSLNWSL